MFNRLRNNNGANIKDVTKRKVISVLVISLIRVYIPF
jgi:hypothetical protein